MSIACHFYQFFLWKNVAGLNILLVIVNGNANTLCDWSLTRDTDKARSDKIYRVLM